MVDEIRLLVVPHGRTRLAEAQVWFAGGSAFRSCFIIHRPPYGNHTSVRHPARWAVLSFKHPEDAAAGRPFNMEDLRDPTMVECVEDYLKKYPAEMIEQLLESAHHPAS